MALLPFPVWRKYVEFRKNPDNDEVTDGVWAAQQRLDIEQLQLSKKSYMDWADEVLKHRRARIAEQMLEVDKGLLLKAKAGNTAAVELLYRRFENWTPKQAEAEMKRNPTNKTFAELVAEGA